MKKRKVLLRVVAMLPLPVALLLRYLAGQNPAWVERYFSAGLYPRLAAPVSRLMAVVFPFPIVEVLVIVLAAYLIYLLVSRRYFRILVILCLIPAILLGGWGLNYFRLPLEKTLGLEVRPAETEELVALCEDLIGQANENWSPDPPEDIFALVPAALDAAAEDWPIPRGGFAPPKEALSSGLMSRLLIEGISSPFTAEALVNGGIPPMSLPYVACHEAAHVRGFAREEDANLIAWLACSASDVPYFRYSGAASMLVYALDALKEADEDAYYACYDQLSEEVRGDFAARTAYWEPYREAPAAEVGERINDTYLRQASDGGQSARSYGEVVDLLLALARNAAQADEG